jgi:hypothetical protein
MENSTFWNEPSAAPSVVTRVNMSADGRILDPVACAKRKYNSSSDIVLNEEVWLPIRRMRP